MKFVAALSLVVYCTMVNGAVLVAPVQDGLGTPGNDEYENATQVSNDVLHVPQYMPGFPTAGTIWPRIVQLPCKVKIEVDGSQNTLCEGFKYSPAMGRAEYLFFEPIVPAQETKPEPYVQPDPPPVKPEKKKFFKRKAPKRTCHK